MGVFDEIYKSNTWGFGSGHGSLPSVTKSYRAFIEMFITENGIRSVVDVGCGDWQFSKLIKWGDTSYTGVDVVPSLIDQNNQKYGSDKVRFQAITPEWKNLPQGDLLICKDVLQHLSDEAVQAFVKNVLPKYRYALITNCILPTTDINKKIANGEFRPLDIRKKPFNVSGAKVVFAFTGPKQWSRSERKFFPAWKKLTLLVG